jgi:hypothetical protein
VEELQLGVEDEDNGNYAGAASSFASHQVLDTLGQGWTIVSDPQVKPA